MKPLIVVALTLLGACCLAQDTWVPTIGGAPWHDRVGLWEVSKLPDEYVARAPVPQQSCTDRTLVLPDADAAEVVIAISATESTTFATKLGLEATGDQLSIAPPGGGAELVYDILVYKTPPLRTEFTGAKAGVILLSWPGELEARAAEVPAGSYVPADKALPWHDRVGQWVLVDVPPELATGLPVPQQSCTDRSLVLPREGLAAVTIGVAEADVQRLRADAKLWPAFTETPLAFAVQGPTGGRKITYRALVYKQPPRVTRFEGFTAGVILLTLTELGAGQDVAQGQKGATEVLKTEQEFIAQEWPFAPGERKVKMHVETPTAGITANTGLMLVLHNWGGKYNEAHYVAWCREFADRYNVVALSVNYLQSGDTEPRVIGEKPYDHGYLQAMDCLRALWHVRRQLAEANVTYNPHRCYSMGGSGGGNVTLMVNKLAPRSFACVVDICGMPGLTDGIAYGTGEYGSSLNAGYSRDPQSPAYLTPDMQQIRDPGYPPHLAIQYEANPQNKMVIVHGLDDASCPVVHKIGIFRNMVDAGFRPDGHFLTPWFVDGEAVTATAHAVGNREKVVERFADCYMLPDGKLALQTPGPDDFERGEDVVYPTAGGRFVVSFAEGPPTIRFEPVEG